MNLTPLQRTRLASGLSIQELTNDELGSLLSAPWRECDAGDFLVVDREFKRRGLSTKRASVLQKLHNIVTIGAPKATPKFT